MLYRSDDNPKVPGFGPADQRAYYAEQKAKGRTLAQTKAQWKRKKTAALGRMRKKAAALRAKEVASRQQKRAKGKQTAKQSKAEYQFPLMAEAVFKLVEKTFGKGSWQDDMVSGAIMWENYPASVEFDIPTHPNTHQSKYADVGFTRALRSLFRRYPAIKLTITYSPPRSVSRRRAKAKKK